MGDFRFCSHQAFKHAPLLRVSLYVSRAFLVKMTAVISLEASSLFIVNKLLLWFSFGIYFVCVFSARNCSSG